MTKDDKDACSNILIKYMQITQQIHIYNEIHDDDDDKDLSQLDHKHGSKIQENLTENLKDLFNHITPSESYKTIERIKQRNKKRTRRNKQRKNILELEFSEKKAKSVQYVKLLTFYKTIN